MMPRTLLPAAQGGVGIRIAHDPGDPLITSHCPFCGSGQVVGRSDGTIECDFCGQNYIVRVQPAFPGMPQPPGGPGAPSDIGPDGGVLPPDAIGPDGLPMGGEMPPEDGEEDAGGFPTGEPGEDEEDPDGDGSEPPGAAGDEDEDSGPPPPPKPKKKKASRTASERPGAPVAGVRTYLALDGKTVLTEGQYTRHLAVVLSGGRPDVLASLRAEAAAR